MSKSKPPMPLAITIVKSKCPLAVFLEEKVNVAACQSVHEIPSKYSLRMIFPDRGTFLFDVFEDSC